jgi:hypothetical protein
MMISQRDCRLRVSSQSVVSERRGSTTFAATAAGVDARDVAGCVIDAANRDDECAAEVHASGGVTEHAVLVAGVAVPFGEALPLSGVGVGIDGCSELGERSIRSACDVEMRAIAVDVERARLMEAVDDVLELIRDARCVDRDLGDRSGVSEIAARSFGAGVHEVDVSAANNER